MCRNDALSWLFFVLFAENIQILLKISVIPILLTFMYLVALNLLVINNSAHRRTQLIIAAHNCHKKAIYSGVNKTWF